MEFLSEHLENIYVIILSIFIGIEVISNVPSILHTPLMSGANAISGIVVVGAIAIMFRLPDDNYPALILGGIAVFLGTLNCVGGFKVTHRMLKMFNPKDK